VDDEGRYEDDPRLVKADVYPYDDITAAEVDGHLRELADAELIHRYAAEGARFLHVLRFRDDGTPVHQRSAWGQRPQKATDSRWPGCGEEHHGNGQTALFDVPSATGTHPVRGGLRTGTQGVRDIAVPKVQGPRSKVQGPSNTALARFTEFYDAYPRHTAPRKAEEAWAKALKREPDPDVLITAAARFAADPNREDAWTAMPATWLNQDRWKDDPLPPRRERQGPPAPVWEPNA
jgi:hypothetical protein